MKKIIPVLIFLLLLTFNTVLAADLPATTPAEVDKNCGGASGLCLNIPIGGIDTVSSFEQYLQLWYTFVVGAVGIIATVIIMWGGFKWLTSRGNAAAIGDAKDRIWSAIIGLVLVFLSYNILSLINPKLVDISLPTLKTQKITVTNTDNNLDNDKDVIDQLLSNIAQISYDVTPIISPGLEATYIAMETGIEWLISQNDQQALESYLASHNVNITDSNGLLQANTRDLVAISRIGNTFGEVNVEYSNGAFILDQSQTDIVTGLLNRDGVANGENGNRYTTNITNADNYQITRITDLNFDYIDSQGGVHNYNLSATGNGDNDGRWILRFQ